MVIARSPVRPGVSALPGLLERAGDAFAWGAAGRERWVEMVEAFVVVGVGGGPVAAQPVAGSTEDRRVPQDGLNRLFSIARDIPAKSLCGLVSLWHPEIDIPVVKGDLKLDMRRHHVQHHLLRPSRAVERFVREPDWPLREAGSSFAHHALSLLGTFAPLLALALVGLVLVPAWRVWGRHRLVAAGGWLELRLGEQVSRPALEALIRTLAGGLPRPLFGAAPWVALSLSSLDDRASCALFISGGEVTFYLEIDRATEPARRVKAKLDAYRQALAADPHRDRGNILLVCVSRRRLSNLARCAPPGPPWVWGSTDAEHYTLLPAREQQRAFTELPAGPRHAEHRVEDCLGRRWRGRTEWGAAGAGGILGEPGRRDPTQHTLPGSVCEF